MQFVKESNVGNLFPALITAMSGFSNPNFWATRTVSVFSPPELYLTDNLDQMKLMPETKYRNKFRIAMDLYIPHPGPFFFIQVLNDNSPEGDNNR
jgi:hypothetical protein